MLCISKSQRAPTWPHSYPTNKTFTVVIVIPPRGRHCHVCSVAELGAGVQQQAVPLPTARVEKKARINIPEHNAKSGQDMLIVA